MKSDKGLYNTISATVHGDLSPQIYCTCTKETQKTRLQIMGKRKPYNHDNKWVYLVWSWSWVSARHNMNRKKLHVCDWLRRVLRLKEKRKSCKLPTGSKGVFLRQNTVPDRTTQRNRGYGVLWVVSPNQQTVLSPPAWGWFDDINQIEPDQLTDNH